MKIISPIWLSAISFIFLVKSADSSTTAPLRNELSCPSDTLLNYRLPNETYPEHYHIKLTTDVYSSKKGFQGKVIIDIIVVTATNKIVLHAQQMEISEATIANPTTGKTERLSYEYELEREFLTLSRKDGKLFKAGTRWHLIISYSGQLRDDNLGFFSYSYIDESGTDRYGAATLFAITHARHAFPCYDEPAKRAKFTITINHSPKLTAISNMPVNEEESRPGKTVFLTTKPMPTYLVAFIICDFEYTEVVFNGISQRIYSRSSKTQDQLFALNSERFYMTLFEDYYRIDYMLPKLDFVAVPHYKDVGATAWGLNFLDESYILYNKASSGTNKQTEIALYVARAVASQWFEHYAAIQWWSSLWLPEGLATLFAYKAVGNAHPEFKAVQMFYLREFQWAMNVAYYSTPISAPVQKPSDSNLGHLSKTSGLVLLMWQSALGEEVFRRATRNYLMNNRYRAATDDDFFAELEELADKRNIKVPDPINKMMKTWTRQGGYPLLTVTRNYENGSFTVKQEAFIRNEDFPGNRTWYVPINFAVASQPDFQDRKASHYLPNTREIEIDAQLAFDDWIVLNKRSEYYYRIKYDEQNYKLITKTLIEDPLRIHALNRFQLLDDVLALTTSKRLNFEILFKMLTYLKKEPHYVPWKTVTDVIGEYQGLHYFPQFKEFFRNLVAPIFQKLGVNKIPNEEYSDQEARNYVMEIACWAGVKTCLVATHENLKAHLFQNRTIEPDLDFVILKYGLVRAHDTEFDVAFQKLMSSKDSSDSLLAKYSFGLAENKIFLRKFISSSIDMSNNLSAEERVDVIRFAYIQSKRGLLACIEFLNENWEAYGNLQNLGSNPLDAAINEMSCYVFHKEVEAKLLALVATVKDSKHVSQSLESDVKQQIDENYKWLQEYGTPILEWISGYSFISLEDL